VFDLSLCLEKHCVVLLGFRIFLILDSNSWQLGFC
jgi:hypothetical protein